MMPLRFALRRLAKSPGYTAVALLTLALGIGVNTSMFSVVDALLFRSAPFPKSAQLTQVSSATRNGDRKIFSAIELREVMAQSSAFSSLTAFGQSYFAISEPGQPPERIPGTTVSEGFAGTFMVAPMIGRPFSAEEFLPGGNHVVLLSHRTWQDRFAGAPDVLGRTLRLDGENVTIIGVMPQQFDYGMLWHSTAFWRPLNFTADQLAWRDYHAFQLIGRLREESSVTQAAAELAPLAASQEKEHPDLYGGLRYRAVPLQEALIDHEGRNISWMLLGLSGFVLLIACANLANLQLARAAADVRDLAIRAALGASRTRLIVQQLLECVIISCAGGVLSLAVASALNQLLERNLVLPGGITAPSITLNPTVLVVAIFVSLLTGIVFGIVPAWIASRTDMNAALKQQTRGSTTGRGQRQLRQLLIVGEVALALVLLGGAAILHTGFARLLERQSGWDSDRVITAAIPVPETRIDTDAKRVELFRKLEARLVQLPGVEHAAIASSLPIFSYTADRQVLTEGQTPGDPGQSPSAFHVMVSSDYFTTVGIPLVEGRLFAADITARGPRVIVINESLARKLWPGQSAMGRRLGSMDSGKPYWAEVIGVVRDVDTAASVGDPATPYQVYKPLFHEPWSNVHVVLRSATPAALADTLRRAIAEVDPDIAAAQVGTVRQLVGIEQRNFILVGQALTGFAILGLILASIGLYGVVTNLVAQRTAEFGIRLALGARPRDILFLVLNHGLVLTMVGVVIGLAGAYGLGRFLGSMMPRVATPDPVPLLGVSAILLVVALVSCWLPARSATKVDPMTALRAE